MSSRRLIIIEYVGWNISTFVLLLWALITGARIRYGRAHPRAVRFWNTVIGQDRFAEIESRVSTDSETHFRVYNLIEQRGDEIDSSPLLEAMRRFFPHAQDGAVVRKALIEEDFLEVMLRREVEFGKGEQKGVVFTRQWRPYIAGSSPGQQRVRIWDLILRAQSIVRAFAVPVYFAAGATRLLVRRGVSLRPPVSRYWAISQIVAGDLSPAGIRNDSLIYDKGDLAPENILHILNEAPSPGYFGHARARKLNVVYPPLLRGSLGFIWRRLICGYYPLVLKALRGRLAGQVAGDLAYAVLRLGYYVLETELLALHHRSGVCIGWDVYSVKADIRAMVWERNGGSYIGFIHGFVAFPLYAYHDTYVPILLIPGPGIARMLGETLKHVPRILPVGYMKTEMALGNGNIQDKESRRGSAHMVVAFDSSFSPFWGLTFKVFTCFYSSLLALVKAYPEIVLCLKIKYRDGTNQALTRIAADLIAHPRIRVVYDEDPYHLLAMADSVIAMTTSSVGWEALACRKATVFFDPRENYESNLAWRHDARLVCRSQEELLKRYREILAGQFLDSATLERIVLHETRFADSRPLTAVKHLLLEEANSHRVPEGNKHDKGLLELTR